MKSWIFALVGLSCLIGSLTVPAIAQQGTKEPAKATDQKPFKPIKFKLEWVTTLKTQATTVTTETVIVRAADGQTIMTNNPVGTGDMYRRVTIHPEIQTDGSYLVDITVNESNKEQDNPRISTILKMRPNETELVQSRISKGTGYEYEYLFSVTPTTE